MAGLNDLREAITATGGAASPLVPKIISPLLLEYVRRFAPLRVAFARQTWETDVYYFNQRTAIPRAQPTTEAPPLVGVGSVTATNSTYVQNAFPIKHIQSNGDVSLFAQKIARVNGSLLDLEMEGSVRAMGWLEDLQHLYGSAASSFNTQRPQWDGLRLQVGNANKIDATTLGSSGILNLSMLDSLMDAIRSPLAANPQGDDFFFVMSPRMQSKLVQLTVNETRVLLEKRTFRPMTDGGVMGDPITVDMVDPGVEVYSYRNIPIMLTTFLSAVGQMSAVALSQAAGSTPFQSGASRFYTITAVTMVGETLASAEQTVTIGSTGNSVSLTWSTPVIPDPASGAAMPIFSYYIWEAAVSGKETLLAVVPAFDANDNPVTSFTDLGVANTTSGTFYQVGPNGDTYTFPNVSVAGNANGYGSESIYMVTRDPNFVVVPVVNDLNPVLLALTNARTRQYAITADETLAVRAPLFLSSLQRVRFL